MASSTASKRLKELDAFASLSDKDLKKVADAGRFLHLPKDWSLMSESTPADKAYVLLSGEVSVRKSGQEVARVGAGGVIGEIGILEHRLRTASVVSVTELEVVHYTKEDLARLVEEVPDLREALHITADAYPDGE